VEMLELKMRTHDIGNVNLSFRHAYFLLGYLINKVVRDLLFEVSMSTNLINF
jgi:hypothetical protein